MKILFDCPVPFQLAHGGAQIQIEQTKAALEKIGVEVEFLRWWDASQRGDVLQFFGRPSMHYVVLAQKKGMKVVFLDLLTAQGSRSPVRQRLHRLGIRAIRVALPSNRSAALTSGVYLIADACLANTPWEAHLMSFVFGAPRDRVHVVANGVEDVFFQSRPLERGKWLVSTATITPRKRVLELAQAAVKASTPLWMIGTPYSTEEHYFRDFSALVESNPDVLRYDGGVTDRSELAAIYRQARGFVLLSTMETRSLSSEEAAACECPLLLSDLPWARSVFGESARYCRVNTSTQQIAEALRRFYREAPNLPPPLKPKTWLEVAEEFRAVYAKVLREPGASSVLHAA